MDGEYTGRVKEARGGSQELQVEVVRRLKGAEAAITELMDQPHGCDPVDLLTIRRQLQDAAGKVGHALSPEQWLEVEGEGDPVVRAYLERPGPAAGP